MARTSRFCGASRVPVPDRRSGRGLEGRGAVEVEVEELVTPAAWLAASAPPVEPPPELEARVLEAVRCAAAACPEHVAWILG